MYFGDIPDDYNIELEKELLLYSTGQPKTTKNYKCLFSFKKLKEECCKKVNLEKSFNPIFGTRDFKIVPIDSF